MPKKNDSESHDVEGLSPDAVELDHVLGYEQARDQLAEIASQLERGNLSLEESLSLWERGEKLADICEQWLTNARDRVNPTDQPPAN
jgi:exodeoxyribonuclease VII small subunit